MLYVCFYTKQLNVFVQTPRLALKRHPPLSGGYQDAIREQRHHPQDPHLHLPPPDWHDLVQLLPLLLQEWPGVAFVLL